MNYGTYRTKTYIAADWTGDKDAVEQMYKWNDSDRWALSFVNAHNLTQARDDSLQCSIKASLKKRLDVSKTFVLIVGNKTKDLRSGSCSYCDSYNSWICWCARGHSVDCRSYIEYECDEAIKAGMKIVVLYNSTRVDKSKCPEKIRDTGNHLAMCFENSDGKVYWNYPAVKKGALINREYRFDLDQTSMFAISLDNLLVQVTPVLRKRNRGLYKMRVAQSLGLSDPHWLV